LTFFFDRSLGKGIPRALNQIKKLPVEVIFHQQRFPANAPDDIWLPEVGRQGWIVLGQDYRYHTRPNELFAIQQYNVGCFYLWGSNAPQWDTFRCFARAYDKIADIVVSKQRPFLYVVHANGRVVEWDLRAGRVPFGRSRRAALGGFSAP